MHWIAGVKQSSRWLLVGSLVLGGCGDEAADTGLPTGAENPTPGSVPQDDMDVANPGGDDGAQDPAAPPGTMDPTPVEPPDTEMSEDPATVPDDPPEQDPVSSTEFEDTFRVTELDLIAPSFFLITDITSQLEGELASGIEDRSLNIMLRMDRADAAAAGGQMRVQAAECTADAAEACYPDPELVPNDTGYTNVADGTCLQGDGGTSVEGPCFVSDRGDLDLALGNFFVLPLTAAEVAGGYPDGEVNSFEPGLLYGFLTETDAQRTNLPDDLTGLAALVAGRPLSDLLRDEDKGEHDGEPGWWMTVGLKVERQAFTDEAP